LVSLDLALGEGRWQADGHALLWACEGGLWCRSAQGDRLLDASTGRALPDPAGEPLSPPWRLPHRYLAADAHFGTVAAFLRKRLGVEAAGAIDYWEQGGTMAVGYHAVEGIRYSYWLLLLDGQGEVLAHDRLHEGGKGIGTEGFGLLGGALFYLRQGVELWRRPLPIE
jgi:hypothetical protein